MVMLKGYQGSYNCYYKSQANILEIKNLLMNSSMKSMHKFHVDL